MNPEQLTIASIAIAIGIAGLAKKWVFGWTYEAKVAEMNERLAAKQVDLDKMEVDRNFWRNSTLTALGHADKALGIEKKGDA